MSPSGNSTASEGTVLLHRHDSASSSKGLGEDVPLYSNPRQRQRWDDQQILPHVNWGDLFFDLFYVAAAFNLAVILKESPSGEGLFYFVSCFLAIIMIWFEKLAYDSRFCPEDNLFHRGLELFHLLLLGTVVQHIRPVELMKDTASEPTTLVFALSLTSIVLVDMKRYHDCVRNVIGGSEAKHQAYSELHRLTIMVVPYTMASLVAARDFFYQMNPGGNVLPIVFIMLSPIAGLAYALLDAFYLSARSGLHFKEVRVPMNVDFSIHRMGEWVMLMLGESVLALLVVEETAGRRYYVTFYCGILSVTMMQYLYFRSQPFEAEDHAMRATRAQGFWFYYGLLFYSATLIVIGCSFKSILHLYIDEEEGEGGSSLEEQSRRVANMFSWSLACSFFLTDWMILSHRGLKANLIRLYNLETRCFNWPALLCCLVDWLMIGLTASLSKFITNLEVLSVVGCVMVTGQVLLRTLGLRFFPVSKKAMEHACRWPNVTEPRISVTV